LPTSLEPHTNSAVVVLVDTNAVFKLYFFFLDDVIKGIDIVVDSVGVLKFHQIVKDEFQDDLDAWYYRKHVTGAPRAYPRFFDSIQEHGLKKLEKFINDNLTTSDIGAVDVQSRRFERQKVLFEVKRKELQAHWIKAGTKGKKVTSVPSDNDYSLLSTAIEYKLKMLTCDEILLEVSKEFHEESFVLELEDVLKAIYNTDVSKQAQIKTTIQTLDHLSETIKASKIFN
jgi:hypothetical protein